MEYTINQLAKLSGISTRTLRYYDQIGLLCPVRIANGYRIYRTVEVDLLQQILFYRALDVSLEQIGHMLKAPAYDKQRAMQEHLSALLQKKHQIELLIDNVTNTIDAMKGETTMNDQEKFKGFKQKMIDTNENSYGKELRQKYGEEVITASYAKIKGMSEAQWQQAESLRIEYETLLKLATEQGNPASDMAQKVCALHKAWICLFWKDGTYSPQAHKALAEGYVADERFLAYYDHIGVGCAAFLRDAIAIYCGD